MLEFRFFLPDRFIVPEIEIHKWFTMNKNNLAIWYNELHTDIWLKSIQNTELSRALTLFVIESCEYGFGEKTNQKRNSKRHTMDGRLVIFFVFRFTERRNSNPFYANKIISQSSVSRSNLQKPEYLLWAKTSEINKNVNDV